MRSIQRVWQQQFLSCRRKQNSTRLTKTVSQYELSTFLTKSIRNNCRPKQTKTPPFWFAHPTCAHFWISVWCPLVSHTVQRAKNDRVSYTPHNRSNYFTMICVYPCNATPFRQNAKGNPPGVFKNLDIMKNLFSPVAQIPFNQRLTP